MSFSPLGNYLPILSKRPLNKQAAIGLALEAGMEFIGQKNPILKSRARLVSLKAGLVRAVVTSAPAKAELMALKESLFKAMKLAAPVEPVDLRIEVKGTLVDEDNF